jgi:hypothetical protein
MNPDEIPSPEEQKLMLATIPTDAAAALKLVSAMAAGDRDAVAAQLEEIAGSPRYMYVMTALASITSRLAFELTEHTDEKDPQTWLHATVLVLFDDVDRKRKGLGQ